MGYFQVRYDSRGVNYDRRGFIRLATEDFWALGLRSSPNRFSVHVLKQRILTHVKHIHFLTKVPPSYTLLSIYQFQWFSSQFSHQEVASLTQQSSGRWNVHFCPTGVMLFLRCLGGKLATLYCEWGLMMNLIKSLLNVNLCVWMYDWLISLPFIVVRVVI